MNDDGIILNINFNKKPIKIKQESQKNIEEPKIIEKDWRLNGKNFNDKKQFKNLDQNIEKELKRNNLKNIASLVNKRGIKIKKNLKEIKKIKLIKVLHYVS